jgi:hypothetical protein
MTYLKIKNCKYIYNYLMSLDKNLNNEQKIVDRNNTNFPVQLLEYITKIKDEDKYTFLKYYQNITRKYVLDLNIGSKGLLIAYDMGMGKSMIAISITMDLYERGYEPIILATKSLHENMRKSIIKYVRMRTKYEKEYKLGILSDDDLDKWIDRYFAFVSMNASNMMKQMTSAARSLEEKELDRKFKAVVNLGNLDGKLLIVDEAHNLFRAITNGSKNAVELYKVIVSSKNVKVIFLTGTPIASDSFELVPCFNMIANADGRPILPEDWTTFYKLYVNNSTGAIKNKEKFQNRLFGLVSYASHKSVLKDKGESTVNFPEEYKMKIVFVNMSRSQFMMYQLAREKEKEENKNQARYRGNMYNVPLLQKPKSDTASSYRVRSRQISNYAPPSEFIDYVMGSSKSRKQKELTQAEEKQEVGTEPPVNLSTDILSKIDDKDIHSPKLNSILNNINKHQGQLGLVYSQFIGTGGLGILQRFLRLNGYELYKEQTNIEKVTSEWLIPNVQIDEPKEKEAKESNEKEPTEKETTEKETLGGRKSIRLNLYPTLLSLKYKKSKSVDVNSNSAKKWSLFIDDIRKNYVGSNTHKQNSKLDSKQNSKQNSKLDSKQNSKLDSKQNSKLDSKLDSKQNSKLDSTQNSKLDSTQNSKLESKQDSKLESKQESKQESTKKSKQEKSIRKKTFAVVYGEINPEERQRIQDIFNSNENKQGGIIDLILISSTGAEGLDLKNVRHIHIMEPYWNYSRISQVKHRGIRNDSHIALPPSERNVSTYIYLSIKPDEDPNELLTKMRLTSKESDARVSAAIDPDDISEDGSIPKVGVVTPGPDNVKNIKQQNPPLPPPLNDVGAQLDEFTTDVKLFRDSIKNQISIDSFNRALQEISIECGYNESLRVDSEFEEMGIKCRICQPNNRVLFHENPEVDIKGTDRCTAFEKKTIQANEVLVNGVKYYYVKDNTTLYGVKIYEFEEDINGYRPLSDDNPLAQIIIEKLEQEKKIKLEITV